MNILLVTNTYTPHVGGVARSVSSFREEYLRRGHQVMVVAPEFKGRPQGEENVARVPAIVNFNSSDFSVALPLPAHLGKKIEEFSPDLVHSQHPFLLGMTAVRIARYGSLPLIFTHHTFYEHYTHYLPVDMPLLRRFVKKLATHYANLCDHVFAPSASLKEILLRRGVTTPITVLPTGVQPQVYQRGDRVAFRDRLHIPRQAPVVGHMGRLAPEKNIEFLARAVGCYLQRDEKAHFLVIGQGPFLPFLKQFFNRQNLKRRVHLSGQLQGKALADGLHAMDVFAFASKSETQGMVLNEAMAAGLPVVALDAPGTRDMVIDGHNGRLILDENDDAFCLALQCLTGLSPWARQAMRSNARATARHYSLSHCADTALDVFTYLSALFRRRQGQPARSLQPTLQLMEAEWNILKSLIEAGDRALEESLFDTTRAADDI
jgi:glycosyltransferase involved in cell wall biosynthesis